MANFLFFDQSIFDYVNERWNTIYWEYDEGFQSDDEKGTCSATYTECISPTYAFAPGGDDEKFCINVTITYTWECPGGDGGFVPGGPIGPVGGGQSGGAGSSDDQFLIALNQLIASCSSETSPDVVVDNPIHDENQENCAALLAAVDNLGFYALPPALWLNLFEDENLDLLLEAGTIDPADAEDYSLFLVYTLSGQTNNSFRAFQENLHQVNELQTTLGLDADTYQWLLNQTVGIGSRLTSLADEIEAFLDNNTLEFDESATEAARIYLELKMTDEEFSLFEEEFEAAPTWWFPFVKEIAKEAVLEIIKRRVSGSIAGLPQDLIEAIDAISNGDVLGVLGEALDIAKRFFPALQGVDTFLDGVELIGEGTRAWRAISKLRNFGDDLIQNVLSTVQQRLGGLLGNFRWAGNSTGIQILGISQNTAFNFFDDLVTLFPGATLATNPSHPDNIRYDLPSGVSLEYQPTSSSSGSGNVPSIRVIKSGFPTIKLRLNP